MAGEDVRWGPVSEAGEYAFDVPHLLSTRRIGPDLTRVGLKYGDDWHYAHHWDPRLVVPDSVMPSFKWLYTQVRLPLVKTDAGLALPPAQVLRVFFTMKARRLIPLYPNAAGLTFVPPPPDGRWPIDGTPTIDLKAFGSEPPALGAVTLVIPTRDLIGLVAYIQKLGTDRGAWREVFEPRLERPGRRRVRAARPGGAGSRGVPRALYRVSRPQGRRQRPRGDVSVAPSARLHARGLQVPDDAIGIAADRRRSLSHGDPRRALDGHAHVA